ncbi:hypothetical protein GCM10027157_07750 [Corynebacterium aquatimens]
MGQAVDKRVRHVDLSERKIRSDLPPAKPCELRQRGHDYRDADEVRRRDARETPPPITAVRAACQQKRAQREEHGDEKVEALEQRRVRASLERDVRDHDAQRRDRAQALKFRQHVASVLCSNSLSLKESHEVVRGRLRPRGHSG